MSSSPAAAGIPRFTNRQLLLPYAAPYFAYVGLASLPADLLPPACNYLMRIVASGLLLAWAWRWYCPLRGPRSWQGSVGVGLAAGLIGLLLWLALLLPFVGSPPVQSPWSPTVFLLRLCSASLLVPIFEELLMRGYLFRLALQWDWARQANAPSPLHHALDQCSVDQVTPGAWSWSAILFSTAAFVSGHALHEWLAATGYGLLMAWLWVRRRDLIACMTAHAATNATLALFVLATGRWDLW